MYNDEVKQDFLEQVGINPEKKIGAVAVFISIAPFEQRNGLDVAEMDKKLCLEMLQNVGINEFGGVRNYISRLKKYTKWCKENSVFASIPGGVFEISPDDVDITDSLKGILFKDEFELLDSIRVVRDFDSGCPEVAAFCLYWLGVTKDEVVLLKDTDVDLDNRVIHGQNGVISEGFSDAICDILTRYRNCKWSTRQNGTRIMRVRKDLSVDTFLKRMLADGSKKFGKPVTKVQITALCQDVVTDCSMLGLPSRHTFQNVWRCGRYNHLYALEQSGEDVMNRSTIEKVFRGRKSYYDATRMYQYYKKVFDL